MRDLRLSNCTVDLSLCRVTRDGEVTRLTAREAEVLKYLAERPEQTVTRGQLLADLWGFSTPVVTRAVDSTVGRLRLKIEPNPSDPTHIITIQAVGYRFAPAAEVLPELSIPELPPISVETNAFFGRQTVRQDLRALYQDGHRILSLVGPPGAGKTRIAKEFALWASLEGGACFCDLTGTRTVSDVLHAVAAGLGLALSSRTDIVAATERIGGALSSRGRLVVLFDNFEQVASVAAHLLVGWFEAAPEALMLVTSRERLRIRGEFVVDVGPLKRAAAVALFVDRARLARSTFQPPSDGSLEDLVTRLDGLPLAIELAAARTTVLGVAQIRDRLTERFRLLRGMSTTLHQAIAWSWELLTPEEQSALVHLSVFRGGFTVDAAEAVVSAPTGELLTLDVVLSLRDKSLLHTVPSGGRDLRLALYESVREYALEHQPLAPDAPERHAHWFAGLGRPEAMSSLVGEGAVRATRLLLDERINLLDAVEWALDHNRGEMAASGLLALLEILRRNGPVASSSRLVERALGMALSPRSRAWLLYAAASAAQRGSDDAQPIEALTEALGLGRELGDTRLEALSLCALGEAFQMEGDRVRARAHFEEASTVADTARHADLGARILDALGHWHHERSDAATGEVCFRRALELAEAAGDRRRAAGLLGSIALCELHRGDRDSALATGQVGLDAAVALGDGILEAANRAIFADIQRDRGDLGGALINYQLSLESRTRGGLPAGRMLNNMALIHEDLGEIDTARDLYLRAIDALRRRGYDRYVAFALGNLAEMLLDNGKPEQASPLLNEALGLLGDDDALPVAAMLAPLAVVLALEGDLATARSHGDRAMALTEDLEDPLERAKILCRRAEVEVLAGSMSTARAVLAEAEALVSTLGGGPGSLEWGLLARLRGQIEG